jgi:hypothetical protein
MLVVTRSSSRVEMLLSITTKTSELFGDWLCRFLSVGYITIDRITY